MSIFAGFPTSLLLDMLGCDIATAHWCGLSAAEGYLPILGTQQKSILAASAARAGYIDARIYGPARAGCLKLLEDVPHSKFFGVESYCNYFGFAFACNNNDVLLYHRMCTHPDYGLLCHKVKDFFMTACSSGGDDVIDYILSNQKGLVTSRVRAQGYLKALTEGHFNVCRKGLWSLESGVLRRLLRHKLYYYLRAENFHDMFLTVVQTPGSTHDPDFLHDLFVICAQAFFFRGNGLDLEDFLTDFSDFLIYDDDRLRLILYHEDAPSECVVVMEDFLAHVLVYFF